MDEVDIAYIGNISSALASKDIDKLMELVPSISEEDAISYIKSYEDSINEIRNNNRNMIDTSVIYAHLSNLTHDLYRKAHLSGRGK